MLEGLGVFWVLNAGSATLALIGAVLIWSLAKESARHDAVRTLASIRMTAIEGLTANELQDLARRADNAQWNYERRSRWRIWASYAVSIFAAPSLSELFGYSRVYRDESGFLESVDIPNFHGIVTTAVVVFVVTRLFDYAVFRFYRGRAFTELNDQFLPNQGESAKHPGRPNRAGDAPRI
jgi:hypothetical protein